MSLRSYLARPAAGIALALLAALPASATTFTQIAEFSGANGNGVYAGLTPDGSGGYYGMSSGGGAHNKGAIFQVRPPAKGQTAWTETVIYSFTGLDDGAGSTVGLVRSPNGVLYGMSTGGYYLYGTVFSLALVPAAKPLWAFTTLHNFGIGHDGAYATGGMLQIDSQGALYGTTEEGGQYGFGMVFRLAPPAAGKTTWSESHLHDFTGGTDGSYLEGGVTLAANDVVYGTAAEGGTKGQGTLFQIAKGKAGWAETTLHSFTGADGSYPTAAPVLGVTSAAIYGTTSNDGPDGRGTVYSAAPPPSGHGAWQFRTIHPFLPSEGQEVYCGVSVGPSGTLYGAIRYGGAAQEGSVYALTLKPGTSSWKFTTLHNFAKTGSGGYELGCATLSGNSVVGGAITGGTHGDGTLFAVTP